MRRKPNLTPRMERCAHLLMPQPETLCGKWAQTFGFDTVHLELGCGKGLFIAETAKSNRDVLYIAMEKTANVLVTAMERVLSDDIKNLRYINGVAETLASYFAPDEVSRLYINFCDPWPSRKHEKRRLTGSALLTVYEQILSPDGEIFFKTDNLPLFEYSLGQLKTCGYTLLDVNRNLHSNAPVGIMTEYETKFYEQGLPIYFCRTQVPDRGKNDENN